LSSRAVRLRRKLNDIFDGFVGAVIGGFKAAVGSVLGIGAMVETAVGEWPAYLPAWKFSSFPFLKQFCAMTAAKRLPKRVVGLQVLEVMKIHT
jgi:hypothetical protein